MVFKMKLMFFVCYPTKIIYNVINLRKIAIRQVLVFVGEDNMLTLN